METGHGEIFGHRQPKGPATRKASLHYRATSRLYPFTLPEQCQRGVIAIGQMADGQVSEATQEECRQHAFAVANAHYEGNGVGLDHPPRGVGVGLASARNMDECVWIAKDTACFTQPNERFEEHIGWEVEVLRDLVGNPYRSVAFEATWRTPTILSLAQRAYDDRQLPSGTLALVLLAALSDALEQAGCADREILGHLRQERAVHVRGCWVVDSILDRR